MAEYDGKETHSEPPVSAQEPYGQDGIAKKILHYSVTRIPTLIPPMNPAPNPFKALALLNKQQWLFFGVSNGNWTKHHRELTG